MTSSPGRARLPAAERWSSLAAPSLVLLTPFTIFVRHHDYSLLRPEVAIAALMIGALGWIIGVMLALRPASARVAVAAVTCVLFVDLQFDWIDSGLDALLLWILVSVPLWWLRQRLGRVLAFAAAAMIVATLPLPPGSGFMRENVSASLDEPDPDLPPIVHLVLDEHIAVDGIPARFDPDGRISSAIAGAYSQLGFQVFARAFSRHFTTAPSLSHLVNLSAQGQSLRYFDGRSKAVRPNAYFERLSKRGYRIEVLQTDYLDFCAPATGVRLTRCSTYTLESPKAIEDAPLSLRDKARTIAGMALQRSHLFKEWRRQYKALAERASSSGVTLPDWPFRAGRMSTVSSMRLLPKLHEALSQARPGTVYFAHLLLPHFPYAYDRACAMRPAPVEWLTYKAPALRPTRNDPSTRAERYPPYLEQLECTSTHVIDMLDGLMTDGALKDAVVIVHGDHGSRINLTTPNQVNVHRMHPADFTDAFSTHFAIRIPGNPGSVDRREIAIDELLAAFVRRGSIPEGTGWVQSQDVIITGDADATDLRVPMQWTRRD